jgi:hypothetical protein
MPHTTNNLWLNKKNRPLTPVEQTGMTDMLAELKKIRELATG